MLTVDGQQPASTPLPGGQRQVAGCDEALLVGEREVHPVLERPKSGLETSEADDRVQDNIRLGCLEQLDWIPSDLRQRRKAGDR